MLVDTNSVRIYFIFGVSVFIFLFVLLMTDQINTLLEKEVSTLNDKKIISEMIHGDEQMLAFAVRKYSKLLWKIAASILINAASAQDVEECIADVFIHLWQCPEKYDSDKGRLSSWLSMIARSKAIDRYRQIVKKRELPIEEIAVESLICAEITETDAEKEKLLFCIEELDEKEKELIIRRYYYEQKPAEIAVVLDIPKKQVENKLYYVKQKLKKMME